MATLEPALRIRDMPDRCVHVIRQLHGRPQDHRRASIRMPYVIRIGPFKVFASSEILDDEKESFILLKMPVLDPGAGARAEIKGLTPALQ